MHSDFDGRIPVINTSRYSYASLIFYWGYLLGREWLVLYHYSETNARKSSQVYTSLNAFLLANTSLLRCLSGEVSLSVPSPSTATPVSWFNASSSASQKLVSHPPSLSLLPCGTNVKNSLSATRSGTLQSASER